jgi:hypothetical protein
VIWALGGTPNAAGDYDVYRYNGGGADTTDCTGWLLVNDHTGDGRYIDVHPNGSPWVTTVAGTIYHLNGVSGATPTGTTWSRYLGLAKDIAIGPDDYGAYGTLWRTRHPSESTAMSLLNLQDAIDSSDPPDGDFDDSGDTMGRSTWVRPANGGQASFITIGRNSMPWVIGPDKSVWRRGPQP